jgi:hypothetical protein
VLPTPESTTPAQPPAAPRVVDSQEKALAKDWQKRIDAALKRHEDAFKKFNKNRKLLRGENPDGTKVRANLYFANLATMRPQVYAKDPEYSIQPSAGVPAEKLEATRKFCNTAEQVLTKCLVKEGKLKKRAKRLLTAAYATSVGWWKCSWQEAPGVDPIITDRLKDTQDNLERIKAQKAALTDQAVGSDLDLQIAKLNQSMQGLQAQTEVSVARGLVLDFVLSEDVIVLDESVRELQDYERASALAHRVWFTREKYKAEFGYAPDKAKRYAQAPTSTEITAGGATLDSSNDLFCVWEIWDQDSNSVLTLCDGEEGFCKPGYSPEWTGERWFPFFAMAFNEIEGAFYPLSDIELTTEQITDINTTADDFRRDRKGALPINIVRKGGSLTPDDLERIKNRQGSDIVVVEGPGGQPLTNDMFSGQLAHLDAAAYDTSQSRAFMEQIVGGGDAARGTVQKAKTATEAEILSQGLRGRSAERTDTMEDILTEVGIYALQVLLRKLTPAEVEKIAGPEAAVSWPSLTIDDIFGTVTIEVRGGSTGKPDRLQEQDRWTKVMPVIEKTIQQVAELRAKGEQSLANALVELAKETLKRFDERLDIEQFLPAAPPDGQADPAQAAQENAMLKAKVQQLTDELADLRDKVDKGYIQAAAAVATSPNPAIGAQAFGLVLDTLEQRGEAPEPGEPAMGPGMVPPGMNMAKTLAPPGQPPAIAPQSAPPPGAPPLQ